MNKDAKIKTDTSWFLTILIFIINSFSLKIISCTSCLNLRFKHSADSNACKMKSKWKKAKVITTRNIYKGQSMYRRYQALNTSSSGWIPHTVAFEHHNVHTTQRLLLFVSLQINTIPIGKMQHDDKNKNSSLNSLYCIKG